MHTKMQHWINEFHDKLTAFCGGAFTGSIFGVQILGIKWESLVIQGPLKVFMAVVISFMGGIAGLAAKDFYVMAKKWVIEKINKNE